MIDQLFKRLGLHEREAVVYVALLNNGALSVRELAKHTGIPRPSLYGNLELLLQHGLVMRIGDDDEVTVWQAESPTTLSQKIDEQITHWELEKTQFKKLLPALTAQRQVDYLTPKFVYLDGVDDIRQAMNDVLLYENLETEGFWPIVDMLNIMGEDFLHQHNIRRIRNNISIRSIWPKVSELNFKQFPFLGVGPEFKREIRQPPDEIECNLGYWAYQNKVLFISSHAENFGFLVESADLRQTLKTQFDFLWARSDPLKPNEKVTRAFLDGHFED